MIKIKKNCCPPLSNDIEQCKTNNSDYGNCDVKQHDYIATDCLTLGQRLRIARELKKLTPEDVSKQLFIHIKIITALEEDDYSQIVASVYARGYVISYAKLLQLPIDEIMQEFAKISPFLQGKDSVLQLLPETISNNHQEKQEYQRILFYIASAILLIAIGFGFYSHSKQKQNNKFLQQQTEQANTLEAKIATTEIPANVPLVDVANNKPIQQNTAESKSEVIIPENKTENNVKIIQLKAQEQQIKDNQNQNKSNIIDDKLQANQQNTNQQDVKTKSEHSQVDKKIVDENNESDATEE